MLPLALGLAVGPARLPARALGGLSIALGLAGLALVLGDGGSLGLWLAVRGAGEAQPLHTLAGVAGLLVLGLAARSATLRARPGAATLLTLGLAACGLAPWMPGALALAVLPLAWAVGELALAGRRPLLAVVVLTIAGASLVQLALSARAAEGERRPWLEACAWVEAQTPQDGAWGAATAVRTTGVLIEPGLGAWPAWFARRASVGFGDARVGEGRTGLARRLAGAQDLDQLARLAAAEGVSAWILGPGSVDRLGLEPGVARALEALRVGEAGPGGPLERVWASAAGSPESVAVLRATLPDPGRGRAPAQARPPRGR